MDYYIHHVPGRLRVKTPVLKKNKQKAQEAEKLLKNIPGICSIVFKMTTGSMVIHYDSMLIQPKSILIPLKEKGYIDPQNSITNDQYVSKIVQNAGDMVVKQLFGLFLDHAFKGTPLSYVTVFI